MQELREEVYRIYVDISKKRSPVPFLFLGRPEAVFQQPFQLFEKRGRLSDPPPGRLRLKVDCKGAGCPANGNVS
jgi:hypothetical protein